MFKLSSLFVSISFFALFATANVPLNDDCSNAISLGVLNPTCINAVFGNVDATAGSVTPVCTGDTNDIWFTFIKPEGIDQVFIQTSIASFNPVSGTTIEVFQGSCGALNSLSCSGTDTAGLGPFGEIYLVRPVCSTDTLFIRITGDNNSEGNFNLCVRDAEMSGKNCAEDKKICTLPFIDTGMTTAGYVNDYDSLNTPCHLPFTNGEDFMYSFIPDVSGCYVFSIASADPGAGLIVTELCPNSPGSRCIAATEVTDGISSSVTAVLDSGALYFIMIDSRTGNINFDFSMSFSGAQNPFDLCSNAMSIGVVSNDTSCQTFSISTSCTTPTISNFSGNNIPDPNCGGYLGFLHNVTPDAWAFFTTSFTGNITLTASADSVNPASGAGIAVYTGMCTNSFLIACDMNSGPNGMPEVTFPVIAGVSYYLRFWSTVLQTAGNISVCIRKACTSPNDFPCDAIYVPFATPIVSNNLCSTNINEPDSTFCLGGQIKTSWYKTVVPPTGELIIRARPLSYIGFKIKAFSFPSGCVNAQASYTVLGCESGNSCSSQSLSNVDLVLDSLIPGDTIYFLTGSQNVSGHFELMVVSGTSAGFPPVYGKDCSSPIIICNADSLVDEINAGVGNVCDLSNPSSTCFATGERNSKWLQFTLDPADGGGTATVSFDLFPGPGHDVDFILWDVTSLSDPCPDLNIGNPAYIACNYCATSPAIGMKTPVPDSCYEDAFSFTGAPRTFLLLLQNWNSSANDNYFIMNWLGTPMSQANVSQVAWTGGSGTSFQDSSNWGSCGFVPDCNTDVLIQSVTSGNSPVISGNVTVGNLTIAHGAVLTLDYNSVLNICGDIKNYGVIAANLNSKIRFVSGDVQEIEGNFTGPYKIKDIEIAKSGGSVILNSDLEIDKLTIFNDSAFLNLNGHTLSLHGNFSNFKGDSTLVCAGNSILEFKGNLHQTFTNQNLPVLSVSNLKINKTANDLGLIGNNSSLIIDSSLVLLKGRINTGQLSAPEVFVRSNRTNAISGYNYYSYVNGRLRRSIYDPAAVYPLSLDFPVGSFYYQLANVSFISPTQISDIVASFKDWPAAPPLGPDTADCFSVRYDAFPLFNHGYWMMENQTSDSTGMYNITLYNSMFANNVGIGWTAVKAALNANVLDQASWELTGTCHPLSTPSVVQRDSINAIASALTSFNHLYAVAQTPDTMITGFTELSSHSITVFPNPSGGEYFIQCNTNEMINVEVYNIQGRLVHSIRINDGQSINISSQPVGMYFIHIENSTGSHWLRVIRN